MTKATGSQRGCPGTRTHLHPPASGADVICEVQPQQTLMPFLSRIRLPGATKGER